MSVLSLKAAPLSAVLFSRARPALWSWDRRQLSSFERIRVIPRSLLPQRTGEDRNIATAVVVGILDAPFRPPAAIGESFDFESHGAGSLHRPKYMAASPAAQPGRR